MCIESTELEKRIFNLAARLDDQIAGLTVKMDVLAADVTAIKNRMDEADAEFEGVIQVTGALVKEMSEVRHQIGGLESMDNILQVCIGEVSKQLPQQPYPQELLDLRDRATRGELPPDFFTGPEWKALTKRLRMS